MGIMPEPLSAFLFSKQPELPIPMPSLPVPSTHPDPRALRLPGEKRCGRLKDGSVSNRMPALFYAYKAVTLPLRPQNSKSSLPSPSDVRLRRRAGA